jgi:aromatic ring-opening dioxygenase catalytic subunit (LigB family)
MNNNAQNLKSAIIYLSHGGGPLPLLGDKDHQNMRGFIRAVTPMLIKPSAILVISAHWEAQIPSITSGPFPSLIYDYYGFPKEAYDIKYPVAGSPELAKKIAGLLGIVGIDANLDNQRGFDHGLFIPLKLMFPDATIPCVQLSLVNNLQPELHLQMGKALRTLKKDNVLIIGSGFSFHNLKSFFVPSTEQSQAINKAFEQWLMDTCSNNLLDEAERKQRLTNWDSAPGAKYCHPREEHLLPLHLCYGAAGTPAKKAYQFEILGKMASAYIW